MSKEKVQKHYTHKYHNQGFYIVFEGTVGSGKTTQSKRLVEYLKKKFPNRSVIWTREPGGTEIADSIRKVVQGTSFEEEMEPICEAYLYAASRAQTLRKVVEPVLKTGGIVVADRSFLTSTVNQGSGRGVEIDTILEINKVAVNSYIPDIVICLEGNLSVCLSRTSDQGGDKFEKMDIDFYKKIARAYKEVSKKTGIFGKWINIDASKSIEEVFKEIVKNVASVLSID